MSTPHFHALIHLVNLYQHETLATIAQAIEKKWQDPLSVVRFSQWLHAEEPPDAQQCEQERAVVEQAWWRRFDDGKHESLCVLPKRVVGSRARNSWTSPELTEADAAREAGMYRRQYDVDAQFVFSRVQEHFHQRAKEGFKPFRTCLSKKCITKCKHGFPIRIQERWCIVCPGNHRRLKVRISGRRNSIGCILGKRSTEYQSATMRAFAVAVGSNTHTAPNYRLPQCGEAHDPACKDEGCIAAMSTTSSSSQRLALLRRCKAMQRASREMAGYFSPGTPSRVSQ